MFKSGSCLVLFASLSVFAPAHAQQINTGSHSWSPHSYQPVTSRGFYSVNYSPPKKFSNARFYKNVVAYDPTKGHGYVDNKNGTKTYWQNGKPTKNVLTLVP
jgi:hypothetical protein